MRNPADTLHRLLRSLLHRLVVPPYEAKAQYL